MDTKKFIDNKMTLLAEEINDEIRKKKLTVIADSSFVDAVNNSTTAWIIGGTKIIKSIDKGEIKSITDLNPVWKQYADGLKKAFKIIPLYLNELCNDRRKLEMELTSVDGYLKKFSKYIISRQAMIGAHKLPYFIFFAKLERGEISQKNIEQEMAILEDSFIKKDLISRDLVTFYK